MRTMLTHLPEAIPIFEAEQPTVQIVPEMQPTIDAISSFMRAGPGHHVTPSRRG